MGADERPRHVRPLRRGPAAEGRRHAGGTRLRLPRVHLRPRGGQRLDLEHRGGRHQPLHRRAEAARADHGVARLGRRRRVRSRRDVAVGRRPLRRPLRQLLRLKRGGPPGGACADGYHRSRG